MVDAESVNEHGRDVTCTAITHRSMPTSSVRTPIQCAQYPLAGPAGVEPTPQSSCQPVGHLPQPAAACYLSDDSVSFALQSLQRLPPTIGR